MIVCSTYPSMTLSSECLCLGSSRQKGWPGPWRVVAHWAAWCTSVLTREAEIRPHLWPSCIHLINGSAFF